LRQISHRRADYVVSVGPGIDAFYKWLPQGRRLVIPNPMDVAQIQSTEGVPVPLPCPRNVVSMGRLEHQKGFDLLIEAFAGLGPDFKDWGLVILGEGRRRQELQRQIDELGLADRILLAKPQSNPFVTLRRADLFVMPSRYEGFGNALVEAMICGLPAIATDCWSAPMDIIQQGVDGLIVPPDDVKALREGMQELMRDPARRQNLAEAGQVSAQRYELPAVMQRWEQLIADVLT
jgi:glycosyltransferase involved in cell wall biosynthesis